MINSTSPNAADADFEPDDPFESAPPTRREFDPTSSAWYIPIDPTAVPEPETVPSPESSRNEQLHKLSLMLHQPDDFRQMSGGSQIRRTDVEQNQRQYARCPFAEDRTTGVLTLNGRRYNCRMVEMSIGGFGVIVEGHPKFKQGTTGSLRAPGLNFVVSVTRQEGRPGGSYVGLRQVREVVEKRRNPGEAPPIVNYCIAAFSGAMIVIVSYFLMYGGRG